VTAGIGLILSTLALDLTRLPSQPSREVIQGSLLIAGWQVAAGVGAEMVREHAAYLQQAQQRAAEAERTSEETALRRAAQERLRIARELHDSLTHSISVIKVQAGVAVHLARKRGEEVPEALLAIQEASGDAVRELRATLHVLRHDIDTDDSAAPSGLDRLPDLLERLHAVGVPVTVTISGDRRALPADTDRAAYRIVQEALTNITRHAGPASVSIELGYGPSELTVQVDDDGVAAPDAPPVPGLGLLGMRERVAALGGRLHAAPRPEGGFTVRAELPLPAPTEVAEVTAHAGVDVSS
jgi:signal transduction histidine kinase